MELTVWEWDGSGAWQLHTTGFRARVCRAGTSWRARIETAHGYVLAPNPFAERQHAMDWWKPGFARLGVNHPRFRHPSPCGCICLAGWRLLRPP